ncbi:hypothetical protein SAMN06265355_111181 [Actinomadura mexicana]|uniref:Uncharacterized protein n=1 Tax=Actinomadura mexicana TaxID=134959 RepID=A0A239BYA4_9ACTN|nr:hypothetical protein SAMN06265355_111181 [Actinomadura mexicana]
MHRSLAGLSASEMDAVDKDERDRASYALAVMNSIAIGCQGGYVDRSMVKENMGRSFVTTVRAAREFIDYLEKTRGFRPYGAAEKLAVSLDSGAGGRT